MIVAIVVLSVLLAIAITLIIAIVRQNLEMADQRDELVVKIEESLDELDACYGRLARNSEVDVLSDEPIIREVMGDIRRARNVVLTIASRIVTYDAEEEGNA